MRKMAEAMTKTSRALGILGALTALGAASHTCAEPPKAPHVEQLEVRKIWDRAPHNAFTDLVRWKGRWWCAFREGKAHVDPFGALRVIVSDDGRTWQSAALMKAVFADLRDAKLSVTPDGRLVLYGAAAMHKEIPFRHQTVAWWTSDGTTWSDPKKIAGRNEWLWRVTWRGNTAYGFAYGTPANLRGIRLYQAGRDLTFRPVTDRITSLAYPNESAIVFEPDGTAWCLLRRDGSDATAQLGRAQPPYSKWHWRDLGVRVGGPNMIRLADGTLLAVVRLYGPVRTAVCWIDADRARLKPLLVLPSGGDCSYAGLVLEAPDKLWISYYSSHEGKTSIYLAKVRIGRP